MATTTNFGWDTPDDTDLVKDGAAAIRTALDGVDTSFVDLKGGTTGQVLAKNSDTDLDFVWSADAAGMTNPMTTTGDIIYSSPGSTPVRLGVGSTADVLTVAGGVPTWAAPAAGGGWTSIATGTLSGASTTVSFTSGGYYSVVVIVRGIILSTAANVNLSTGGGPNFGTNTTTSVSSSTHAATLTAGTTMAANSYLNNVFSLQYFNVQTESPNDQQKPWILTGFYQNSSSVETPVLKGGALQGGLTSIEFTPSAGTFSGGSIKVYGVK
jgi:hypothetical protein